MNFKLILLLLIFSINSYGQEFTKLDSVFMKILDMDLDHPTIVMSQVILESGHMESWLYKENNNLFAMKKSGQRITTTNKIKHGFKDYSNWQESLYDYGFLQVTYYKGFSRERYLHKLGRSYASSKNYIENIKSIEKNLNRYFSYNFVQKLGVTDFDR